MSTEISPHFPLPHLQVPGLGYYPDAINQGDSTLEGNQDQVWQELTRFYAENRQTIERAAALDITAISHPTEISTAIDSFTETVKVVLDGLVVLGNIHPVLGVAIFAFHSVISLDLTRRESNKKIIAVKLQMQNMMCALFQLRKLKHSHVEGEERKTQRVELQCLVKSIANDITACGSDLNYYKDRRFISKLIKAKVYEQRFAEHIETFIEKRAQLQDVITAYTAASIESANIAVAEVNRKIDLMDGKLNDIILGILHKLDSRQARDALSFVESHGGVEQCVNDDDLLSQLLSITEEPMREKNAPYFLNQLRDSLIAELNENLEDVLERNYARFAKLLAVQNNNLQRIYDQIENHGIRMYDHGTKLDMLLSTSISILEEGKIIKKAVLPNTTVKIKDPELQLIWDRMGLKGSVKAKTFVLTLRDHLLADCSVANTPRSAVLPELQPDSPMDKPSDVTFGPERDQDSWFLKYIDVPYVRPIVEAMDEDGSGFISVKEANKFALSRPAGWKLFDWMAYWAAGWHINITKYRTKIYSTLRHLLEACDSVHPANRVYAAYYFECWTMIRLEGLLHSVRPLQDNSPVDSKISDIAQSMAYLQEKRLLANLQEVSYVIKSPSDVTLIAGPSRIETWILPLLHLVLEHHLEVMKLAETIVLDHDELASQVNSISSIFSLFEERLFHLEAIFRQMYRDVEVQFKSHSYGMFFAAYKGNYPATENLLSTFMENEDHEKELDSLSSRRTPPEVAGLSLGRGPVFNFEPAVPASRIPEDYVPLGLEGAWLGMCAHEDQPYQGTFAITIGAIVDNRMSGEGDNWSQKLSYYGSIEVDDTSMRSITVFLRLSWPSTSSFQHLLCRGVYDSETETIKGVWVSEEKSPEHENSTSFPFNGDEDEKDIYTTHFDQLMKDLAVGEGISSRFPFLMTKGSTSHIFRFGHLLGNPFPDLSWTLARKRWAFATESVLFETRRRMGSSTYWGECIVECRKYVELSVREYLDGNKGLGRGYLTEEEKAEYERLKIFIHPSIARLLEEYALYIYQRCIDNLGAFLCDVCDQEVKIVRFICITCIEEDLSNQIDMCAECINSPVFNRETKYVHHPSHTLIRFTRQLHACLAKKVISEARRRSEKIKLSFKALETKSSPQDYHEKVPKPAGAEQLIRSRPSVMLLICTCCRRDLTLPCWACLACETDFLLCLECQRTGKRVHKHISGFPPKHLYQHPLLLINQADEVKTSDIQMIRLESNITSLSNTLMELEQKMSAHNAQVQDRLNKLEKKVDNQLGLVTSLLQELVLATRPTRDDGIQKSS